MSFMSDYRAALKKLKKEEEEQTSGKKTTTKQTSVKTTKNGSSFMAEYEAERDRLLAEKEEQESIQSKITVGSLAPVKEEKERTWFDKGAFRDGYQFGDVSKVILGTIADVGENVGAGIMGMGEKAVDALAYLAPAANVANQAQNSLAYQFDIDEYKKQQEDSKKFIQKDLYNEEEIARKIISSTVEKVPGVSADNSVLGEKSDSLVQSGGQLLGTMGLQAVGVPWWLTYGTTTFGEESENALNQGASYEEAGASAAISAAAEVLTERLSGGIKFGGKTLDDALTKQIARSISNKYLRTGLKLGLDAVGEGMEEWITADIQKFGQWLTYQDEKDLKEMLFSEEAMDEKIEAFIGGAALGGGVSTVNAVKSTSKGVDYATEMTANEKNVVDKVYQDRVAELEQNGKVTEKQKSKVYDEVLNDFEKGYISTETIEEVLGDKDYQAYKETTEYEDSIFKEYEELGKKQNATLAEQSRYNELQRQVADIKKYSTREALKNRLSESVYQKAQGDRLVESYNERARRGQVFEADVSKYDQKQQQIIQNAINSGTLNNTRRTHELVDFIAKVSADKGVLFDFTNNEKIKGTQFAVEGKIVNGYVTDSGITLNMDSPEYLASTVGHEITHVLEGTEFYDTLKQTIFNYAKSKGEYDTRLKSLTELYKNVKDADVEAELTAVLVGDYLFQDSDFVNRLSTENRNVFQKIYDEIKYLCKVATAGSKEARELEKVKKAFEDAYRAKGKAVEGTKHSLSDLTFDDIMKMSDEELENAYKELGFDRYLELDDDILLEDDYSIESISEETDAEPEVIKILYKRNGLGTSHVEENHAAVMTQKRIDQRIAEHGAGNTDYARRYITRISPKDFIDMTVYEKNMDRANFDSRVRGDLDSKMGEWDYEKALRESEEPPVLIINKATGQIIGHNGRHRMRALEMAGVESVEIEVELHDEDGYMIKYNAQTIPDMAISSQFDTAIETHISNLIPLNNRHRAEIGEYYGEKAHANAGVKYSLSDSDGKQLTKEQQEYFKDSKMRDEQGNLKVMYHGTQDAGFHTFDARMSDDDTSFFFVDRNDVAASYSGTTETYEAKTIRTAEDMNNFLAEIGYDHYEAVEKDGKFELLEDGDHVAWSDTAQGIYEEFCWYEGVGNGDANYKVYLNLKNPLEVDAQGRPWNKIDAEFSQEVYDRFQSLTAEERDALIDLAGWEDFWVFNSEIQEARGNELESAYKKLGEDVNIYDLFSIASDSFSEESLRENSRNYLKTRDYAQRAKEQGYDGVIFKNIVDNGGYSNGSEGASTVAIAFDSNQIKSVANGKPTSDPDIRFSLSDARTYAEITEEQQNLFQRERQLADRKREAANNPELLQAMDDYSNLFTEVRGLLAKKHQGTATQAELDRIEEIKVLREERIKRVADLQESLGLNAISQEETEIRETKEALRVAADAAWAREGAEKENKAIAKAGIPAPEYFRKKALKAFKTTTNFNEAGYMLPDGKLLNFSGGERNHRYRDHREIGEIYEATNGVAALNRFLSDGNIRIMAESPGIDLASGVEPTREQYAALRKFINSNGVIDGRFFVDFSDIDGRNVGKYAYNGRIFADRIINDIKYFFQNGKVRESSGLADFLSLSNVGEAPKRYGNFATPANELRLEVAPIADNSTVPEKTQLTEDNSTVSKEEMVAMFPDEPTPQTELDSLIQEKESLESRMTEMGETGDLTEFESVNDRYVEVAARIAELENEISESESGRVNSLGDADAPPEMEAPYSEPNKRTYSNPFADRDWYEVGKNRSTKAFMTENPEFKPFFQEEAANMLYDLGDSQKADRWYNDQLHYESGGELGFGGNKRHTSQDIAQMLDEWGLTYAQIEEGLTAIVEDNDKVNQAAAKRIEFKLHERLANGYKDFHTGKMVEPNQAYLDMLYERQVNAHRQETFDSFMETADQYAPEDIAPVKLTEATPDTMDAPIYQSKDPNTLRGQTSLFEPPKPNPNVAKVLTKPSKQTDGKTGFGMGVVSQVVDKGMAVENLAYKTGNVELQGEYQAALPSTTEAMAQYFMENGAEGVRPFKEIVQEVTKSGKLDDFYEYMYEAHNVDRMSLEERFGIPNKAVKGETWTADISRAEVKRYEKANPEFKEWAEEVYANLRHMRNMLVEGNLISQETANLWEKEYPHYVPITRSDSKGQNVFVPLDSNKTGVNAPIKRATGGSGNIEPLFNTIAQRMEQTYRAIARNSFGIELMNTLDSTINRQVNNMGVDEAIDTIEAQEDHLLKPGTKNSNPTFTVFENGERVEFEITEELFDSLKPAGKILGHRFESSDKKVVRGVGKALEARRNLLTNWNPVFAWYRNPIKDIQDVAVNSQHPIKTYLNMPLAIYDLGRKGKWAQEYHQNGGKSNTYYDSRKNEFVKESGIKKLFGKYEAAGEFIEEIPRLAEFIASRKNGRSVKRSMLDAARVTTNFAAGGDFTKFLNSHGFTFLNASVQGASQHVRNFRESYHAEGAMGTVKTLAKYVIAGVPCIIWNGLKWDDDEEYEELNDYVKQNYFVLWKTDNGKFVRVPKGRTTAVMSEAMQQMVNLVTGDDEVDFSTFFELFMNNIAPNNPLENNIIAPIGQVLSNTAWYGGDLVPTRLQDLPAAEQFDESTDSISKWLGEATNTSPYKWNYILDQYSGGAGDVFLPMITPKAESGDNTFVGNILAPWKKEITTDKVLNNKNPGDFYDLKDELEIQSNSKNATEEDTMRTMYMDSVSWEMSDLYKKKREVQNSDLPDDEKYEEVRNIQEQINELAKNALNNYNHVSINGLYSEAGDKRYNKDAESGKWYEIREKNSDGSDNWYYQKEQEVTKALGISYGDYWNNREEYNYAYDNPEKYTFSKAVGGYQSFRSYTSDLWDIKADKDENGKSISGSRKEKVIDYVNGMDADYGEKIILFKSEYPADDTYNEDIIEYLNGRDDISYDEMETILKYLGFEVDSQGNISWD